MAVLTQQKGENTEEKPPWKEGSESGQLQPGGCRKVGHKEHGARAMGRRNQPAAEDQLVCAGSYLDLITESHESDFSWLGGVELNCCGCRKNTSSELRLAGSASGTRARGVWAARAGGTDVLVAPMSWWH